MTNADIQVGEFVRTIEGYIAKCIKKDKYVLDFDGYVRTDYGEPWDFLYPNENNIIKHSFNLIDLIEVGDYVNGLKVYDIEKSENIVTKKDCIAINMQNLGATILYEKSVKTIVTKEQYKSMEYKVGEEDEQM